jgi:hypothetical protein
MMSRRSHIIRLTSGLWWALAANARVAENFDASWKFLCGDLPGAERPGLDDAAWRFRRCGGTREFSSNRRPARILAEPKAWRGWTRWKEWLHFKKSSTT